MNMQIKIILLTLLLASCGLKPYKMDIHQGNLITAEMRDKLKLGMSKQQVRYVLGTPLIKDAFHGNRWDYMHRFEHGGKVVEQQRLTLDFEGDKLQRIDNGDGQIQAAPIAVGVAPSPSAAPVIAQPVEAHQPVVEPAVVKANSSVDVEHAIQAWAVAWSSRDVAQYFASYASVFKPVGMSKTAWQAQRKQRISKSSSIAVTLSDLNVKLRDDNHASASFLQDYRADLHRDVTHKILQLEKIDDTWLIVSEQTVKQRK